MIVEFDKSFLKSLNKIHDSSINLKLKRIILQIESSKSLNDIPNFIKLTGYTSYYRIRLGDYRIGIELINNSTLRFIVIAHRKDIYKIFP